MIDEPLAERKYQLKHQRSVLDAVLSDAKSMHITLSKSDRQKIEEYFQSVRGIETRLSKAEQWLDRPKPTAPLEQPSDKLATSAEIMLTYDLMVAAIKTDQCRVFTYRQPAEGLFSEPSCKVDGHKTTHCTLDSEAYAASIARDRKKLELVAYLIDVSRSCAMPTAVRCCRTR